MNYPELPALVHFFLSSDWLDIYSSEIKVKGQPVLLYHGLTKNPPGGKKTGTDSVYLYHDAVKVRVAVDELVYRRSADDKPIKKIHEDFNNLKALILLLRRTQEEKPFIEDTIVECIVKKIETFVARRKNP